MDPTQPKPDPLPKPESSKPEESNNCTNFEPFTFEIPPDPLVKTEPDKDCSSSSSSSSCHSSELENEDDFIQLDSIINRNLINENKENENIDSDSDTDDEDFLFTVSEMSHSPNNVNINRTNNNNNTNNNDINNNNIIINNNNNNNNVTNNNEQILQPVESPPIQTMTRSDPVEPNRVEPDPNRIPASIFTPKSNISEWSVTSNESLFSIKIGNNINNSSSRSPLPGSPAGPVPVEEELIVPVVTAGSVISEVDSSVLSGINMSGRYSDISVSQRSDGSMSSLQSFAFPILSAQERDKSVQDQTQVQQDPSEPKPESNLASSSNETNRGNISGNNGNNNIDSNNVDDGGNNNKTGGVFSCFPCCS